MPPNFFNKTLFWVVLLGGTFLRFHALDRQSLWFDELETLKSLSAPVSSAFNQPLNPHPPVYFLQLRVWQAALKMLGVDKLSLGALRANSAFWGVLSLILLYLLVARSLGARGGALAASIATFSPFHLAYSQELRPYILTIVWGLLGFIVIEQIPISVRARRPCAALIGIWVLELYTHYWGLFVAISQMLYGWWKYRKFGWAWIFPGGLFMALGVFSLWLPVFRIHFHEIMARNFEIPHPTPDLLVKTLVAFTGVQFRFALSDFSWAVAPWIKAVTVTVYGVSLILGLRQGSLAARLWLGSGLVIPFLVSYWHPIYVWYRYPFICYPAFVWLVTWGVLSVKRRWMRGIMIFILLISGVATCRTYFTTWNKANPQAVAEYVASLKTPRTVIIRPAYFSDLFAFYDLGPALPVIDEDKLDSSSGRAAYRRNDIVFVAFDVPEDPVGDALRAEYSVLSVRSFPSAIPLHGINVYQLRQKG